MAKADLFPQMYSFINSPNNNTTTDTFLNSLKSVDFSNPLYFSWFYYMVYYRFHHKILCTEIVAFLDCTESLAKYHLVTFQGTTLNYITYSNYWPCFVA